MKKLKMLAVAVGLLIAGSGVQAQTKIGYIDAETILYLMPEVGKIDSVMQIYQRDTVGKEYMNTRTVFSGIAFTPLLLR